MIERRRTRRRIEDQSIDADTVSQREIEEKYRRLVIKGEETKSL